MTCRVIQIENRFQVRDKNVIQAGKKAPHEKQRGHYRQRHVYEDVEARETT